MRKKRVIIFDDEEMVLDFMAETLSYMDYEVLTFREPDVCPIYREDAGLCNNKKPCADIIITDMAMHGMRGIEMIQKQAQRECRLGTRNKAVMSGNFSDDDIRMIEELGCRMIQKPFKISELSEWLNECEQRIDLSKPVGIRRREPRHPVNMEIRFAVDSQNTAYSATVKNISSSGLCLETGYPLVERQTLYFNTGLANSCRAASVCWLYVRNDSSFTAGFSCL
ncbi:response regulator receiver domain protein [bacterium BMS3Abin07]|nr:response regulator receiver domain protein [bacterium BMS3Abin07]GBE32697.1 response regulator receiver domain protein [bacterium BMS3Bbin05]HDL21294.1 response regulator [Nitrospirota bacterium]HDO22089.1 response regulator [Nitrospirota bacterium]HDZ88395.1 response regulator [Nitrospirota bacterium]